MNKNVAVIGVGAVGVEILNILRERKFPIDNLRVFARSAREIKVGEIHYKVEAIEGANFDGINIDAKNRNIIEYIIQILKDLFAK